MKHILGLYLKAPHSRQTETTATYLHHLIDVSVSQEKAKIKDFFSVFMQKACCKICTAVTEEKLRFADINSTHKYSFVFINLIST